MIKKIKCRSISSVWHCLLQYELADLLFLEYKIVKWFSSKVTLMCDLLIEIRLIAQHNISLVQYCFVFTVSKKFEIPTLDLKVYDDLNTEVDEDAFAFLVMKPDLGVLEVCLPKGSDYGGESLFNLESYNPCSPG